MRGVSRGCESERNERSEGGSHRPRKQSEQGRKDKAETWSREAMPGKGTAYLNKSEVSVRQVPPQSRLHYSVLCTNHADPKRKSVSLGN